MKRILRVVTAMLIPLAPYVPASAAPDWIDISGVYACKGHDEHLGAFEDTHELRHDEWDQDEARACIGLSVMRKGRSPIPERRLPMVSSLR